MSHNLLVTKLSIPPARKNLVPRPRLVQRLDGAWQQGQKQQELVGLSTQGEQVIAEKSGHYFQWDQPELVIEAIHKVVDQVGGEQ